MGRLPEAWIAPPATRELRELVRHRAKLSTAWTSLRCQVHAVLAGQGVVVPISDHQRWKVHAQPLMPLAIAIATVDRSLLAI